MPKMKTKSGAKKRFKFTASGKLRVAHTGKNHGMIKRSSKQIRNKRGMKLVADSDSATVRKFLPYR